MITTPSYSHKNNQTTKRNSPQNLSNAVTRSDEELLEYAKHVHNKLPAFHQSYFENWRMPLYLDEGTLIRFTPYEFFSLNSLQRHLEILRAEAEAWLIHQNLQLCELSQWEKEQYIQRAIGILPDSEEERFKEILTYPGLSTVSELKHLRSNLEHYKTTLILIEQEFGQATALAFGHLCQSSIELRSEFEIYGQKIELLFRNIINFPQIQRLLKILQKDNSFETQFTFLATLRDWFLRHMPPRVQNEKIFLLSDFLNQRFDILTQIAGAEVLFASLDSIVLSKCGFNTHCVITGEADTSLNICLEIITPTRSIYWEPLANAPLSYHIPVVKYRGNFIFLIANTFIKMADVYEQHAIASGADTSKNFEKAIGYYSKAIDLAVDFPLAYAKLAQVYNRINEPRQAVGYLLKAIECNPNAAEYHHLLGLAYCMTGDWSKAVPSLKTASVLKPNYIEALNNLAYCYEQLNDLQKAKDIYERLIVLAPNYFEANLGLANVYHGMRKYDKAITYYDKALKINPQSERCFYNLALTHYEKGNIDSSIAHYKKVLRLNPNHAAAWYNLGINYRNKGMQKEAVKCIAQAVRYNPNLMK